MSRVLLTAFLLGWVGLSVLFSLVPALQRPHLADRLRAYVPGAPTRGASIRAARSVREVVGPFATMVGSSLAKAFGIDEDLNIRLTRIHATEEPTEFRVRQLVTALWATVGFGLVLGIVRVPGVLALVILWIAPLLGALIVEQQLAMKSDRWKLRVQAELPVVAEQIAMLLNAGYSLNSAIARMSTRSNGAVAQDLRAVSLRVRQGATEAEALKEWAKTVKVPAVDRLVSVLRLSGEASDLGRIVSDEARVTRDEGHRLLLATMERKAQAVWIPVTVAALVPGVIFLAIPFLSALNLFNEL